MAPWNFYVEGLKNLPAIITAASASDRALTALALIVAAVLIVVLTQKVHIGWRMLALLLFLLTFLASTGNGWGGLGAQLIDVYSGREPHVNHFMLGAQATIRGGSGESAGRITSKSGASRQALWLSTPTCRHGTTDDSVLYASQKQPCMQIYGYLLSLAEQPIPGSSFVNVWRGETDGVNRDLLYVNPSLTAGHGYTLIGFLIR